MGKKLGADYAHSAKVFETRVDAAIYQMALEDQNAYAVCTTVFFCVQLSFISAMEFLIKK